MAGARKQAGEVALVAGSPRPGLPPSPPSPPSPWGRASPIFGCPVQQAVGAGVTGAAVAAGGPHSPQGRPARRPDRDTAATG